MPKELIDRYNHLRYEDQTSENRGIVDFLYENTETDIPEVDVDVAWNSFQNKLNTENKQSFIWLKVAASVVLLVSASFLVWKFVATPDLKLVSTMDERVSVTFPDGSTGILNENSSFSYLEKFGKERNVSLTGEAFFDIKKSSKPFVIDVNGVKVEVLGTAFNLNATENEVELYVERGLVAFNQEGAQTKVAAGYKAVFSKITNSVEVTENASPNINSWSDERIEFSQTLLSDALVDLSNHFSMDFRVSDKRLENCRITVSFDKSPLSDVLKTLENTLGVEIEKDNKTITLSGPGC